ncbi:hypothetical protein [uncultured Gemmiger sp.]|uniref:hypothetical protein n=1 Tax=uncultured Gemmiger sp. TaxID=1623490 RepID=UPI00345C0813
MMDMMIRPLRAEEQKYAYAQSQQITMQTGAIGYLRGDFDSNGVGFHTTWFDEVESRKTDEFKAEFDEVINALRFDETYGGLLSSRSAMQKYGRNQPDSAFQGNYTTEYGFRIDTGSFAYLLRCIPVKGDYNFYCWCFEAKWLDRHLKQAERGIRFIDPNYKELFRIPDGDKIRILCNDGSQDDRTCRYIDDYHMEVGSPHWDSLYHICQFAEIMERNGSTVIPLRSSLPEQCYGTLPDTGELIIVKKGESGYYRTDISMGSKEENRALADEYNGKLGVSKAQTAAMLAGSMFGWAVPAADPKNYDENGRPVHPKRRERGNVR